MGTWEAAAGSVATVEKIRWNPRMGSLSGRRRNAGPGRGVLALSPAMQSAVEQIT